MPPKRRVDCSAHTFMPTCYECSWRAYPRPTYNAAAAVADAHALEVHQDRRAADAAARRRNRAGA